MTNGLTEPEQSSADVEDGLSGRSGRRWLDPVEFHLASSTWLRPALVSVGLLVLMAAYFWRVVILGQTLLPSDHVFYYDPVWGSFAAEGGEASNPGQLDIVAQFYPYMQFSHDAIQKGIFPLWNPYYLSGHQYFAGFQPALLFPLNWFFFLGDPKVAWGLTAILRLWLAALFTYAYLREVKVGVWGALVGAITFALSGYFVVRLHYTIANAQIWLPLLLWFTERIIRRPRLLWVPACAVAFGVQFFAGHPETSFSLTLLWALYAFYRLANTVQDTKRLGAAVKPAALLILSAALGTMIASVQWVPFVDLLEGSATLSNRADLLAENWSASPPLSQVGRYLLAGATVLLPNIFGTPLESNWWSPLLESYSYLFKVNYFSQTRYLGLIPLWLAGVGLATRWRDRPVPFFGVVAVLSLLLELRLPIISLLYEIPPFSLTAGNLAPNTYMTGVAILAGFGADSLARRRGAAVKRGWIALLLLCLLALALALAIYFAVEYWNLDLLLQRRKSHGTMLDLYRPFTWRLHAPLVFGFAAVGLYYAYYRRWLRRTLVMGLTVLLIAAELYAFGWDYNPTLPPEKVFPETAAIRYLREHSDLQRVNGLTLALKPNSGLITGLYTIEGYEDLARRRYLRFLGRNTRAWTREGDTLILDPQAERLLDLTSVRYVVIPHSQLLDRSGQAYPLAFKDEQVHVFENVDALPRASIVHQAEATRDEEASLSRTYSKDFDPHRSVVLEIDPGPATLVKNPTHEEEAGFTGSSAQIVEYGLHNVEVTANLEQDGYLVLTDAYDPDWRAAVDGRSVPLLRANDVFRAVAVPAGEHTITFHYEPRAVQTGLYVTMAGLAVLIAIVVVGLVAAARRYRGQNLE
ncbi:YfhO family protein [Chloroflexota bacterium]